MTSKKNLATAALTSLIALTTGSLAGCGDHSKPVRCYGVDKDYPKKPVLMTKGACLKLADSRVEPASQKELMEFKAFPYNSYVECYGVAAAAKNDCATKTTACGGTAKTAKDKTAWIAIPDQICKKAGGAIVKPQKHSKWIPSNVPKKA